MTADNTGGAEKLTFTSEFKPGQKYEVVSLTTGNETADIDLDGTAETLVVGDQYTLQNPVATKLDASASNGATGFAGTASDTLLTITSATTLAGDIDVVVDGTTYTIESGTNSTTSAQATEIAGDLNNDAAFSAKYVATASGSTVSIAPKSIAIPAGVRVIAIDEVFSNLQSEALGGTSSLSGLGSLSQSFQIIRFGWMRKTHRLKSRMILSTNGFSLV